MGQKDKEREERYRRAKVEARKAELERNAPYTVNWFENMLCQGDVSSKKSLQKTYWKLAKQYNPDMSKNLNKALELEGLPDVSFEDAFKNLCVARDRLEKNFGYSTMSKHWTDEENDRELVKKQNMTKAEFKAKYGFEYEDKYKADFWESE